MRPRAAALPALFVLVLAAVPADGKDIYKPYLDPAIAHHRAVIETLKQLEAKPDDAELRNDLACLIAWDGFWRDALRELERAAELAPKDSRPLFNAGLVRATRGEWRSARSEFRKATKRDPGNWPAWWMLGFSEEKLGNTRAAIEAYKVSLRVDTSLFSPKVNPFAASTQLKSRVLLETFDRRLARAATPFANQIAEPERLAPFFQVARPVASPVAAAAPAPAPGEDDHGKQGPVVTSVAPSSPAAAAAPKRSMESPSSGSGRTGVQLVPDAATRRRDRRLSETPPDAAPAPPPAAVDPMPAGVTPGPGGGFPTSGTPTVTPPPGGQPQQQPPSQAGPGGG